MKHTFSYKEYQRIIEGLSEQAPIMDFSEITPDTDSFCVIRHDVEFSVDRALNLAKFEKEQLNLTTSYLFQIRNNTYNLISDVNLEKLHRIKEMGHKIGFHLHLGALKHYQSIEECITQECRLFEGLINFEIDRFSFHRPDQQMIKKPIQVEGLINCYDPLFFHYYETPHENLRVKYFTDSRHQWQHGHPLDHTHEKIQLLTHPYSWSELGLNNKDNYQSLVNEKDDEMRQSIHRETSTFPIELLNK